MRVDGWRATAILAAATLIVSGLVIVNGLIPLAAMGAGFIPLRAAGYALPPEVALAIPTWLTPLGATLVHGGWAHLALNLVILVYCGKAVEGVLGPAALVVLYVVGGYAAAAGQWALTPGSAVPMIGASGAISALVAAYALFFGQRRARRIGPVPGPVVHVAWLAAGWVGIQLLFALAGMGGTTVAIGAHIGGFAAGLALARPLLLWRYRDA